MNIEKLERAKELIRRIEGLNSDLHGLFGAPTPVSIAPDVRPGLKYGKEDAPPKKTKTKKTRNMTPEGRAAISAAAKRRWAAFKKAKKAAKIA